jgi:hypothetical protein
MSRLSAVIEQNFGVATVLRDLDGRRIQVAVADGFMVAVGPLSAWFETYEAAASPTSRT